MTSPVVILLFPLVTATFFTVAFVAARAVLGPGGAVSVGRHSHLLYAGLLLLPLAVALPEWDELSGVRDPLGYPFGHGGPAAVVSTVAAGLAGVAIFAGELTLSVLFSRTRVRASLLRHPLVEGATPSLRAVYPTVRNFVVPALLIGTAEELLWRGYLIGGAERRWGWSAGQALVVSALAFGLNHYIFGLRNVVLKSLSGLAWGSMFLLSGSLWMPVASHAAFNVCAWRRLALTHVDA